MACSIEKNGHGIPSSPEKNELSIITNKVQTYNLLQRNMGWFILPFSVAPIIRHMHSSNLFQTMNTNIKLIERLPKFQGRKVCF